MFSLEALKAGHGDALILHYGTVDNPQMILIDGGPHHVFDDAIKPRLREMIELRDNGPLLARLMMVSHIDQDHIAGVLDLFDHLKVGDEPLIDVETLWHNSFHETIGDAAQALVASVGATTPAIAASLGIDSFVRSVAAGVSQGKKLSKKAADLAIGVNVGGAIPKFIAEGDVFDVGDDCEIRILNPDRDELLGLQAKWAGEAADLGDLPEEQKQRIVAGIVDRSLANISSLVALVTRNDKTILLTGDARGNSVLAGLTKSGLLVNDKIHVNILKIPHHGSNRNVDADFFERITADHYIFSGDKTLGDNPDFETFEMLTNARGDDQYSIHYNHHVQEFQEWFDDDVDANPSRRYDVFFPGDGATGLWIDLEEPLWF